MRVLVCGWLIHGCNKRTKAKGNAFSALQAMAWLLGAEWCWLFIHNVHYVTACVGYACISVVKAGRSERIMPHYVNIASARFFGAVFCLQRGCSLLLFSVDLDLTN